MYPARMNLHQEGVRRACERFPLISKGMILEKRYEVLQDGSARSATMVRDRLTGQLMSVTVYADTLMWEIIQTVLARIEKGEAVINLPTYAVHGNTRRRTR